MPSDEMSKLSMINRNLESLMNGLNNQRKKTLQQMETLGKLMDFEILAQNPAKKKIGVQTDSISFNMKTDDGAYSPLFKYIDIDNIDTKIRIGE